MERNKHPRTIESKFWALNKQHAAARDAPEDPNNPIARLRSQVKEPQPNEEPLHQASWQPDETLILKDDNPALWEEMLQEAAKVMDEFNKKLYRAIRRDGLSPQSMSYVE